MRAYLHGRINLVISQRQNVCDRVLLTSNTHFDHYFWRYPETSQLYRDETNSSLTDGIVNCTESVLKLQSTENPPVLDCIE